ncbi:hypothetical protein QR680_007914 [Steinernema hermaphroditum]|uniref:Serpentine receptor class gamma n=1 Tax=Steinernema hermaphroditum TaxID=289476 RepID=A0AA39IEM5_9BILA|nr:hypothetical protein QR680_007914 [Steinernema hermaphroditum]
MIPLHLEIVYMLIGIPSLIFYTIVIASLLKKSNKEHFGLAFYRIFAAICVFDCLRYIVDTVTYRLCMCPEFRFIYEKIQPSAFTTSLYFTSYFFGFCQIFGQTLITVNRFSAVVFPLKHRKFWSKYYRHSIFLTVLLGFAFSWHILFSNGRFNRHDIEGTDQFFFTFMFDEMNIWIIGKPMEFNSILSALVNLSNSSIQFSLHTATIIILIRQRKGIQDTSAGPRPKVELNLFVLSLAMFVIGLSNGLYQVVVTVLLYMDSPFIVPFLDYYFLAADLTSLSPPYLLMLVSSVARSTFIETVRCCRKKNEVLLFMSSNSHSS